MVNARFKQQGEKDLSSIALPMQLASTRMLIHQFAMDEAKWIADNYVGGAYLSYIESSSSRYTGDLTYRNEDLVYLFVIYKLVANKYDHAFEKYFLQQEPECAANVFKTVE